MDHTSKSIYKAVEIGIFVEGRVRLCARRMGRGRGGDTFRCPGFVTGWYPWYHLGGFVADARLSAMHWFEVGVNVGRGADGLCPISEALRPRRSRSPTPSGCNGFAPVHVHRLWKPSVGSSVDDLGILTNRAVFVQHNVVGYLEEAIC